MSAGRMMGYWAWGLWLAVSWTWCIALFLPVILFADTGPGSWAIMFVCNVAGAAAMPFIFPSPQASLNFVRRYRSACLVFSWVTLVCQSWFIGWAVGRLPWPIAALSVGSIVLLAGTGTGRPVWIGAAVICWLGTVTAGLVDVANAPSGRLASLFADEFAWHPVALYALPLVFAGFAASPWLDLTFHHALRRSNQPRRAFSVAFPILFGTMLVTSLVWRDDLAPLMLHPAGRVAAWFSLALIAIVLQLGFTAVLHARHLPNPRIAFGVAGGALLLSWGAGDMLVATGHSLNEWVYRASIGFYAVLVPYWIWAGDNATRPLAILLAGVALLLASIPMLWDIAYRPLYPLALVAIALTRFLPRPEPRFDQAQLDRAHG